MAYCFYKNWEDKEQGLLNLEVQRLYFSLEEGWARLEEQTTPLGQSSAQSS